MTSDRMRTLSAMVIVVLGAIAICAGLAIAVFGGASVYAVAIGSALQDAPHDLSGGLVVAVCVFVAGVVVTIMGIATVLWGPRRVSDKK
jgi:hypothetical protein